MAADSQQKRMSVCGVARPFLRRPFPVAVPTVQWRASIGHAYAGVAANFSPAIVAAYKFMRDVNHNVVRPVNKDAVRNDDDNWGF